MDNMLGKVVIGFLKVIVSDIHLELTPSTKTADRFKAERGFSYRDSNIDTWMTERIPAGMGGSVVCYELTEDGHTFMEMAHELLSLNAPHDEAMTAKALMEQGKTFSLKHVEELHRRFVRGEIKICFKTNGQANFFLVHDEKDRVFVLDVNFRSSDLWETNVFIVRFNASDKWLRGHRLFSRNGPPQKPRRTA